MKDMPRMAENYRNINLPEKVIEQIDEIIKIKELGYSSRADFVKDAIRKSVQELMKSGVIKKKSALIRVD